MAAGYSKAFMPLSNVKEKEFLSRPIGSVTSATASMRRYSPNQIP